MNDTRVSIEVDEDLRSNLKAALAAEKSDISKWFREEAAKKVEKFRDKMRQAPNEV